MSAGAIRPTLFLALGGTGKEVLLRLRRKFYERLGVPGLPCTSYLWLDTDTRDVMAVGEKIDDIYNAVLFQPDEKVPLLTGAVGEDLNNVLNDPAHWPHVHEWMYREVRTYGTQIADGAGGVRAIGRLTYFNHFNEINNRLSGAIDRLLQIEAINDTKRFFRDKRMPLPEFAEDAVAQVVLVSSLAGGTGCGTFLDAAFHLGLLTRRDSKPIERIIGILFMPNLYYGGANSDEVAQRSFGNAYAALKELEFYTVRRGDATDAAADFQVEWVQGRPVKVQGPPFAISYIQEMRNEANLALDQRNRGEVFNMVAEALFLDFMPGPFSTAKRSHYSNVAQFLAGQTGANITEGGVDLPQAFARRYASFGMAKIEIPMDQLKAACSAQLAYEIASHIKRPFSDPNILDNSRADQASCRMDVVGLPARFTDEWQAMIRRAVADATPTSVDTLDQIADFDKALSQCEQKLIFSEGNAPDQWGRAVSFLRKKAPEVKRGIEDDLRAWIRRTLEHEARGLGSLVDPEGYAFYLSQYIRELYLVGPGGGPSLFDAGIARAKEEAAGYRKRRQRFLEELKFAVRSTGVRIMFGRPASIGELIGRVRVAVEQLCLARAEEVLLTLAKDLASGAVAFLEAELRDYKTAHNKLDSIAQGFTQKKASFINVSEQVLFIRFFNAETDWDTCYKLGVDDQGRPLPVNKRAEYETFLQTPPPGMRTPLGGIVQLIEMLNRRGEKEVVGALQAYCDSRFWRDFEGHPREVDVLKHPSMAEQWDEHIKRLVVSATPMARRVRAVAGKPLQVRRIAYLGLALPPDQDSRYKEFVDEVQKQVVATLNVDRVETAVTGKPWEVYLYIVSYAFPTPALPIVRECGLAYRDVYRAILDMQVRNERFHIPLHLATSWEGRFEDLEIYDPDSAAKKKGARETLLFGSILKVLRVTVADNRPVFSYTTGAPLWQHKKLGPRRDAEDALAADDNLRATLLRAVSARELGLSDEQLKAYYWALQYMAADPELLPGSPEQVMLRMRMSEILAMNRFADPAGPVLVDMDPAARRAFAQSKCGEYVVFGGPTPVMKDLNDWAPGAAGAGA